MAGYKKWRKVSGTLIQNVDALTSALHLLPKCGAAQRSAAPPLVAAKPSSHLRDPHFNISLIVAVHVRTGEGDTIPAGP